jgi:hypothetical protein
MNGGLDKQTALVKHQELIIVRFPKIIVMTESKLEVFKCSGRCGAEAK